LKEDVYRDVDNEAPPLRDVAIAPDVTVRIPKVWDFRDITGNMKTERTVRLVLETIFERPFPSVRPHWLVNEQTGRRLEIDCYNEELGLCCEVQGLQHYAYNPRFHRTRHCFIKQIYRDRIKKELILSRGLNYLTVPYTLRQDQIPQYILTHLQELGYIAM
jgi:hypothetical protein